MLARVQGLLGIPLLSQDCSISACLQQPQEADGPQTLSPKPMGLLGFWDEGSGFRVYRVLGF